jgi:lipopolysaccharide/colanic/teichoic acid biosynthesis glycosyltransferase
MEQEERVIDPGTAVAVVREPVFRPRSRPRFVRLDDTGVSAVAKDPRTGRPVRVRKINAVEEAVLIALNTLLAAGALVVLAPVILVIAILVRLDSPGPVFYRQTRVGLDRRDPLTRGTEGGRRVSDIGGQPFEMVKFRTMRVDAEEESGPIWAREGDPRVTRVGAFLRRTRLDELPQFWNVLKGEMSIVGPRPERPQFVRELRSAIEHYPLRHQVPPGITGWAQVNRAADQSVDDVRNKVQLDLEYLQRRSLWFDMWIMLKTLPVMFERDHPARPK